MKPAPNEQELSEASALTNRALKLAERIEPLLAGQGPLAQSAALALLTAVWACGHHPASARAMVLRRHFKGIRAMMKAMSDAEHGTTQ